MTEEATVSPTPVSHALDDPLAHLFPTRSSMFRLPTEVRRLVNRDIMDYKIPTYRGLYDFHQLAGRGISFTAFFYYARKIRTAACLAKVRRQSHDSHPEASKALPKILADNLLDANLTPEPSSHKIARLARAFKDSQLALLYARKMETVDEDDERIASRRETDLLCNSINEFVKIERQRLKVVARSLPDRTRDGDGGPEQLTSLKNHIEAPADSAHLSTPSPLNGEGWRESLNMCDIHTPDPQYPRRPMPSPQQQLEEVQCELIAALDQLEKARAVFRKVGIDPEPFLSTEAIEHVADRQRDLPAAPPDPNPEAERRAEREEESNSPNQSLAPTAPRTNPHQRIKLSRADRKARRKAETKARRVAKCPPDVSSSTANALQKLESG